MVSVDAQSQGHAKRTVEMDLAICILFYEKLDQTIECIQSFLPAGVRIYVLNNDSSSAARQTLGHFCESHKQIRIYDSDANLGVGVGRNYLVTHTTEEWLLFVDSDIIVKTPNWLQEFAKCVSRYPDTEVFVPRLFDVESGDYASYGSMRIVGHRAICEVVVPNDAINVFPGGASFVNRKLFRRLGLYDDKMFVGLEDYEYCLRAILLGHPVKARPIPDVELVHDHRLVAKSVDKEALMSRYDLDLIEASYNRITEKHNLILENDWRSWSASTMQRMLENGSSIEEDLRQLARDLPKRIVRRSTQMAVSFASLVLPQRVKEPIKRALHLPKTPTPHSCSLYMTDRCDFRCPGCYRSVIGIKESKEMTPATVQKMLSVYPSLDAFCVAGLGEPTLCPGFADIVDLLRESGKFVGVITNGANSDKLLSLSCEPNYISMSLKGYDSESYLANTGVDAFDAVMEGFSQLQLRFKNVGLSYILNTTNHKDLDRVLPLCDDLKPEFLHLTNYLVYDPNVPEEVQKIISVKDSEIIHYVDEVCEGRDYIRIRPVYVDFDHPKFNCKSYDYVMNLDGGGNIGGCQRQTPPDGCFGNIFTDNDPYNSSEMRRCRDLMHKNSYVHRECRFCFGNWGP